MRTARTIVLSTTLLLEIGFNFAHGRISGNVEHAAVGDARKLTGCASGNAGDFECIRFPGCKWVKQYPGAPGHLGACVDENVPDATSSRDEITGCATGNAEDFECIPIPGCMWVKQYTGAPGHLGACVDENVTDVTSPHDEIQVYPSGTENVGANRGGHVSWAIDNSIGVDMVNGVKRVRKYVNNYQAGSGFVVTPQVGSTRIIGIRAYTANAKPNKDPTSFKIEGSNDGGLNWTDLVSQTELPMPTGRNNNGKVDYEITTSSYQATVFFSNDNAFYTSYRVIFPTVRGENPLSMQVGEVELLGFFY